MTTRNDDQQLHGQVLPVEPIPYRSEVQEGHFVQKTYVERDETSSIVIVDGAHILNSEPKWLTGEVLNEYLTIAQSGPMISKNETEETTHEWYWVDSKTVENDLCERGIDKFFTLDTYANIAGRQTGHVDARIQALLMKHRNLKGVSHMKVVLLSSDGDHVEHFASCVKSYFKISPTSVSAHVIAWDSSSLSRKYYRNVFLNSFFKNQSLRYQTDTLSKYADTLGSDFHAEKERGDKSHPVVVIRSTEELKSGLDDFIDFTYEKYRSGMSSQSLDTLLANESLKSLLKATWGSEDVKFQSQGSTVTQYKVITISGSTGLGKTTQIPQMLYDQIRYKNRYTTGLGHIGPAAKYNGRIMCVQPRRIACTEASSRVLQERIARQMPWDEESGYSNIVGYHIGQQCTCTEATPIVYCTTGIMVKQLIHKTDLNWDYIVLDEVHERSIDCYLLMAVLLRPDFLRSGKTLVLMSATLKRIHDALVSYIESRICSWDDHPWFKKECLGSFALKGHSFPLEITYLDDHTSARNVLEPPPRFTGVLWRTRENFIKTFVKDLIIRNRDMDNPTVILVFLPSWGTIKDFQLYLDDYLSMYSDVSIFKLHSKLSGEKQAKAIKDRSPYRVILSTDVAESSITISDATIVVDSCVQLRASSKQLSRGGIPFKQTVQVRVSQDSCQQRAGRVGRVCPGTCYRMVTKAEFDAAEPFKKAEIQLTSLHEMVLRVFNKTEYSATNEDPIELIKTCMETPSFEKIDEGLRTLANHNILHCDSRMKYSLLPLGKILHNLPVDILYGRLVTRASLVDIRLGKIAVDLAAVASCSISFDDGENVGAAAYHDAVRRQGETRLNWSQGFPSDIAVLLNIMYELREIDDDDDKLTSWCDRNYFGKKNVVQLELTVAQLRYHLHRYRPLLPSLPEGLVANSSKKMKLSDITRAIRSENIIATDNDIALLMIIQSSLSIPHVVNIVPCLNRKPDEVSFTVKLPDMIPSVAATLRNCNHRGRVFPFNIQSTDVSNDEIIVKPQAIREDGGPYQFPVELYLISQLSKCWRDVTYKNPPRSVTITSPYVIFQSQDTEVDIKIEDSSVLSPLILPLENHTDDYDGDIGSISIGLFPMVIKEHKGTRITRYCSLCSVFPATLSNPNNSKATMSKLLIWLFRSKPSGEELFEDLSISCAPPISDIRGILTNDSGINKKIVNDFIDCDIEIGAGDNQFDEIEVSPMHFQTEKAVQLRGGLEEIISEFLKCDVKDIGKRFRVNKP